MKTPKLIAASRPHRGERNWWIAACPLSGGDQRTRPFVQVAGAKGAAPPGPSALANDCPTRKFVNTAGRGAVRLREPIDDRARRLKAFRRTLAGGRVEHDDVHVAAETIGLASDPRGQHRRTCVLGSWAGGVFP